jgi:hypothetical protein
MKRIIPILACAALLAAALPSCAPVAVTVQYEPAADFAAYKTFFLVPPKTERPGRRPLFTAEVLSEIRSSLEKKGLAEAPDRESADLLVHFYAMVKNRRDFVPPAYRVGRWGRVWAVRPGHVVHYKEGTLVVDMVDRARHELVWEGEGRGVLDRSDPGADLAGRVAKILDNYPPAK